MKIRTIEASVSIESRYGMGLSRWDGRKMIAEIGENEDEMLAAAELQQKVEVSLGITKLAAFEEIPINMPSLQSIDPKAKDLKEIIQDCTSIEDLQNLKNEAGRLGLLAEYNMKRETFK